MRILSTPSAREVSEEKRGPSHEDIEYANANRTIVWGLVGTCIAILTFLLVIYFDVVSAGEFNPILFQLSLSSITVSLFLLSFAASYYFRVVLPIRKKDLKVVYHIRMADTLFFLGVMFLSVEPALILLTVRLYYVASIALALWIASIVIGYRILIEFR
jgi:hypothetical protein